ncbi:YbjQ family protein [Thermodesulfobacteriota bacterium]
MEQLIVFLVLLTLGYTVGKYTESKHYKSIIEREKNFVNIPTTNTKHFTLGDKKVQNAQLVYGNAVISLDYFKRFLAGLRNIFGGNIVSYESLVDRARREATLRMKEMAGNTHMIINLRIETSTIGKSANRKNSVGSVEAFAYGTAIKFLWGND